jgi:hypothetical protein
MTTDEKQWIESRLDSLHALLLSHRVFCAQVSARQIALLELLLKKKHAPSQREAQIHEELLQLSEDIFLQGQQIWSEGKRASNDLPPD